MSTSTVNAHVTKVNEIVRSNRRLTVREIAEDCNHIGWFMSWNSGRKTWNAPRCSKICPSVDVARSERQPRNHLLRIVRSRKRWWDVYDVETKVQSSQWVGKFSPRPNIQCTKTVNVTGLRVMWRYLAVFMLIKFVPSKIVPLFSWSVIIYILSYSINIWPLKISVTMEPSFAYHILYTQSFAN